MARGFNGNVANYLEASSTPVTARPLSLATHFYLNDNTVLKVPFCIGRSTGSTNGDFQILLRGAGGGNLMSASVTGGTAEHVNLSGTTPATGVWHTAAVSYDSDASKTITGVLDGGSQASGTSTVVPAALDRVCVGIRRRKSSTLDAPFDGYVAWSAIWNVTLTSAEQTALTTGAHPYSIRPASLVWFCGDMHGTGGEVDHIGGRDLSETGTATSVESPMVSHPWLPNWSRQAAAAPGGGLPPRGINARGALGGVQINGGQIA